MSTVYKPNGCDALRTQRKLTVFAARLSIETSREFRAARDPIYQSKTFQVDHSEHSCNLYLHFAFKYPRQS